MFNVLQEDDDVKDVKQNIPKKIPKYAYVTLVMKGDAYTPGAIAMATSARLMGCTADLVCMVTSDVLTVDLLKTAFDHVIKVDYLDYKSKEMKQKKQEEIYKSWIASSYTKWQCLALCQYEKILFIDADTILVSNLDHLFELAAPAATFSSPWATNFKTKKFRDKEIKEGVHDEFTIDYPVAHGARVDQKSIVDSFSGGYAFIASLVLLKPDMQDLEALKKMISRMEPFGLNNYGTFDEQSLAWFYANDKKQDWTHIHQQYNFIIHKPEWLMEGTKCRAPKMLHYFKNTKPWQSDVLPQKSPWNTDRIWWYVFWHWYKTAKPDPQTLKKIIKPELVTFLTQCSENSFKIKTTKLDKLYFPWINAVVRRIFPSLI